MSGWPIGSAPPRPPNVTQTPPPSGAPDRQRLGAFAQFLIESTVAQALLMVAKALAGVPIVGGTAEFFLTQWATDLQNQANNALATANGAQTTANNAQSSASAAGSAASAAQGSANNALSQLAALISNIPGASVIADVANKISNAVSNISSMISGVGASTLSGLVTFWNNASTTASNAQSSASSAGSAASAAQSTANSASTSASNALGQLTTLIANAGQTAIGDVGDLLAAAAADAQAIIDGINQAVNGGSATGAPASSVVTNLQTVPEQNVAITNPSGQNNVTPDAVGSAFTSVVGSTSGIGGSWSHTVGPLANYMLVFVTWMQYSATKAAVTVTCGGKPMASLGYRQLYTSEFVQVFALSGPGLGSQSLSVSVVDSGPSGAVYIVAANSVSYVNVASVGLVPTTNGAASNLSQSVSSAANRLVAHAFSVFYAGAGETLSGYNKTQRYNSGSLNNGQSLCLLIGDSAGAASVAFSATASNTGSGEFWAGIAVDLLPAVSVIGSGAAMYRSSTASVSLSTGRNLLPASFFGAILESTPDLTVDLSTGKFKASITGWYTVKICYKTTGWSGSGAAIAPVLYKNGSVYQVGQDTICAIYNLASSNVGGRWATDKFDVFLANGDYVQAGYDSAKGGSNPALTGEISGVETYFSIALANRSLL